MPNEVATRPCVLVVDDEPRSVETIARVLDDEFEVLPAQGAAQALRAMETRPVQVVLADQRMPETTGIELLTQLREHWPEAVRIIISGFTEADDIIAGINDAGIYQYITKPWHPDALLLTVRNAARLHALQRDNAHLAQELRLSADDLARRGDACRQELRRRFRFDEIVRAPDSPLHAAVAQVAQMAPHDVSVLITGESGTGKDLFARALHYNSHRADRPFVVENCGAIPNELLESELFGHVRGAYTGAVADRTGLFEEADGGTLFLDEIGEISPAFQVKLLRVLQSGEFRQVGSNRMRHTDVRIVAATNRDLEQEVRAGRFRADLYYRIAEMSLHLPPLRERPGDLQALADHLLARLARALGKPGPGRLSAESLECLRDYAWPGNVRELNNVLKRMLVLSADAQLGPELLPPHVLRGGTDEADFMMPPSEDPGVATLRERVENLEAAILRETLLRHRWNKSRAAEELGLSRVGLRSKLERYGLERKLDS
ncbi:sigma-54-dependent Fis family transcriptional regulator [Acidihalobacter aeolianus]|uniref:Sigma-54-dependent Fis family transcriptional regulator n=1 Tax=Acidihalobacter aeolianus TaxID=2792603 RepID=A0A1D8K920_9GAMM|nr:sigma-54 dependent transcriptional regulator [Acidihalobacter aeolianus]AOV17442.1 sigma-54-dependent Fis family transcriptional regulator [Acidihalobacter aeolianus]